MKKYVCDLCGWEYDEEQGYPEGGIAPGTKWEDVPEDFECPLCSAGKDQFSEEQGKNYSIIEFYVENARVQYNVQNRTTKQTENLFYKKLLTDNNERDIVCLYKIIDKNKEQRCLHFVVALLFLFLFIIKIFQRAMYLTIS